MNVRLTISKNQVSAGKLMFGWKTLRFLISFEVMFTLFLFAGRFKNDPRFDWVPIDITLLFGVLSLVAAFIVLYKRKMRLHRAGLVVLFTLLVFSLWLALSWLWTPGSNYAGVKTLYMLLVIWSMAGAALIVAPSRERIRRFYVAIALFSLWMSIESVALFIQFGASGFVTTFGGHYLGVGRTVALGACVALGYWLYEKRLTPLLVLGVAAYATFVAGARGPLIALVITLLIPLFTSLRMRRLFDQFELLLWRRVVALVTLIAVGAGFLVVTVASGQMNTTLERFVVLFTQERGGTSAGGRIERFEAALSLWNSAPVIGGGIGSFPIHYRNEDIRDYPHNLILEVLAESGLIGLILLASVIIIALRNRPRHMEGVIALMLVVNTFINAMLSGDITDNRLLFMSLGLLAGLKVASRD